MRSESKVPVAREGKDVAPARSGGVSALDSLRQQIDRVFDDFDHGFWSRPLGGALFGRLPSLMRDEAVLPNPSVDIVEKDAAFEVTAELPGMEAANVDVSLANGMLCIRGEKREERDEKRKDYHLSERRYGTFERRFRVPDGVDTDKVEASFRKGVLTVTLPKTPAARKAEKKIEVKA
jgi:HSP20 family protein